MLGQNKINCATKSMTLYAGAFEAVHCFDVKSFFNPKEPGLFGNLNTTPKIKLKLVFT